MALRWKVVTCDCLPEDIVTAGIDGNGRSVFVARAYHAGGLLPGKLLESHNYALISYDRKEIWKYEFEVIHGRQYSWVSASNGDVPANAVVGGTSSGGETLYVGRAYYKGGREPGKIQPSHECLYFPYGSQEHSASNYDVLCHSA